MSGQLRRLFALRPATGRGFTDLLDGELEVHPCREVAG
jgi:hypothetical protein